MIVSPDGLMADAGSLAMPREPCSVTRDTVLLPHDILRRVLRASFV